MPLLSVAVTVFVCFAFIAFGLVLAWADMQSREVAPVRAAEKADNDNDLSRAA